MPKPQSKSRKSVKSRERIDRERIANKYTWLIGSIVLIIMIIAILLIILTHPQEMSLDGGEGGEWLTESGLCSNVNVYRELSQVTRQGNGWNITLVLWQGEYHDNISLELTVTLEDDAVISETHHLPYLASELRHTNVIMENVPEEVEVKSVHVRYLECDAPPDVGTL